MNHLIPQRIPRIGRNKLVEAKAAEWCFHIRHRWNQLENINTHAQRVLSRRAISELKAMYPKLEKAQR